jgi:hypothetical protein
MKLINEKYAMVWRIVIEKPQDVQQARDHKQRY